MPTDMNSYMQKARQYEQAILKRLRTIYQSGPSGRRGSGPAPHGGNDSLISPNTGGRNPSLWGPDDFAGGQMVDGGFQMASGRDPTPADVATYIKSTGGNPWLKKMKDAKQKLAQSGDTSSGSIGKADSKRMTEFDELMQMMGTLGLSQDTGDKPDVIKDLIESFSSQRDRANEANQLRYDQGIGELTGIRDRNQERVGSFGNTARDKLSHSLERNLSNIAGDMDSMSSGKFAFQNRARVDAIEQNRAIDERADIMASNRDTSDTNALVRFIEARTDKAPDFGMLAQLANQYGQSGAGQPGLTEQIQAMQMLKSMFGDDRQVAQQTPQYPVYRNSGRGRRDAQQFQNSMNNMFGGVGNYQNYLGGVNQQIAGGNRGYPQQTPRVVKKTATKKQPAYSDQGDLFPTQFGGVDQGELFPDEDVAIVPDNNFQSGWNYFT